MDRTATEPFTQISKLIGRWLLVAVELDQPIGGLVFNAAPIGKFDDICHHHLSFVPECGFGLLTPARSAPFSFSSIKALHASTP